MTLKYNITSNQNTIMKVVNISYWAAVTYYRTICQNIFKNIDKYKSEDRQRDHHFNTVPPKYVQVLSFTTTSIYLWH
jgi:CRISPR/Cas system-associated endonuclease Cas1